METAWVCGLGWRRAGSGVGICCGLLRGGFATDGGGLWWLLLILNTTGDEVEWGRPIRRPSGGGIRVAEARLWMLLVRRCGREVTLRVLLLWRHVWCGVRLVATRWRTLWRIAGGWHLAAIWGLLLLLLGRWV